MDETLYEFNAEKGSWAILFDVFNALFVLLVLLVRHCLCNNVRNNYCKISGTHDGVPFFRFSQVFNTESHDKFMFLKSCKYFMHSEYDRDNYINQT